MPIARARALAGLAPDEPSGTLTVRDFSGKVQGFMWNERLDSGSTDPKWAPRIAAWITCTSIVMSEMPEEILDHKNSLPGKLFRGFNPGMPRQWPADDAK